MGKKNKGVLKAPKLKVKTYDVPRGEAFVLVISPPTQKVGAMEVPDERRLQAWISAIVARPTGVIAEMYTIKTVSCSL